MNSAVEKFAIAVATGGFGAATGVFVWWMLGSLASIGLFLKGSLFLGVVCFIAGYWKANAVADFLGAVGRTVFSFRSEVLSHFNRLR